MPAGFEAYRDGDFESGGDPFFSTLGGLILGQHTITAGAGNTGSLTDANILSGNPFYILIAATFTALIQQPTVSFAGSTMSWSPNPKGSGFAGTLLYGVR